MKATDQNSAILSGTVATATYFPPKGGRKFTDGLVRVKLDDNEHNIVRLKVALDIDANDPKKWENWFNSFFQQGRHVTAIGNFDSYYKDDAPVYQFKSYPNNIGRGSKVMSQATVTGTVTKQYPVGVVLSMTYYGRPDKSGKRPAKSRVCFVVMETEEQLENKRIAVVGKLRGNDEKKNVFIIADSYTVVE